MLEGVCKANDDNWLNRIALVGSSVQFSSVAQSCLTLWDPMNCSMPGLPVHHQLLEFTQTRVHWVGDAIQPSHPLLSPSAPTFNPHKCVHSSCLQPFPASGSFQMSWLLGCTFLSLDGKVLKSHRWYLHMRACASKIIKGKVALGHFPQFKVMDKSP